MLAILNFINHLQTPPQTPKPDEQQLLALQRRYGKRWVQDRLDKEQGYGRGKNVSGSTRIFIIRSLKECFAVLMRLVGLYQRGVDNCLDLSVNENPVRFKNLPSGLEGFRILQISDTHIDNVQGLKDRILAAIADLEYDLCVITGDYRERAYSENDTAIEQNAEIIKSIKTPVYGILGNHDLMCYIHPLEAAGMPILVNESISFEHKGQTISITGIDDPCYYELEDWDKAAANRDDKAAIKILLAHGPRVYAQAAKNGYDIMLTGHTHGGQICLKGGHAVVNNGACPREYVAGPWQYKDMLGYTSRGAGASGLPLRYNCTPEITVHTLYRC